MAARVARILIDTMDRKTMDAFAVLAYVLHDEGGDMFFWPDTVLEDIRNNKVDMIASWAEQNAAWGEERRIALNRLHALAVEAKRNDCEMILIQSMEF